jgi:chorismate mutase
MFGTTVLARAEDGAQHGVAPAPVVCRGIRGAILAEANTAEAILEATQALLGALVEANGVEPEDLASAIFTTTPDLTEAFPARAARLLGWTEVPLLGAVEMDHPTAPGRCIRVLLHWNTARRPGEIRHVYLRGAEILRASPVCQGPDLAKDRPTAAANPAAAAGDR